jgi:hypothetical protein
VGWNRPFALKRLGIREVLRWCALGILASVGQSVRAGDRLLATGGVTQIEGSGGGGLVPWALITGLGTEDQTGGSAFCTDVAPSDFTLESCGLALGFDDRLELSVAREHLSLGSTAPDTTISQTIIGAKLRLLGDAVFDQDSLWPQLALGVQYKRNGSFNILPKLLGATHAVGTDVYLAATKVWLSGLFGHTWLADLTLRETEANQLGLLGFGGDLGAYHLVPEGSLGVFLTDNLVLGAEERDKHNDLSSFRENDFRDLFLAWWPTKHFSATLAYADLGNIANKAAQSGPYVSLQASW